MLIAARSKDFCVCSIEHHTQPMISTMVQKQKRIKKEAETLVAVV